MRAVLPDGGRWATGVYTAQRRLMISYGNGGKEIKLKEGRTDDDGGKVGRPWTG